MELSLTNLREVLNNAQLQSPDLILWFGRTAFPTIISRGQPHEYLCIRWERMQERPLTSVVAGFTAKSDRLSEGFRPISFNPPLDGDVHAIRLVRFIPDSGEISVRASGGTSDSLGKTTLNCKIKSAIVVAKIGSVNEKEREFTVEEPFDLRVTMHNRAIEI